MKNIDHSTVTVKVTIDPERFTLAWVRSMGKSDIIKALDFGFDVEPDGTITVKKGAELAVRTLAELKAYMEQVIQNEVSCIPELANHLLVSLLERAKLIKNIEIASTPSTLAVVAA